MAKTSKAKSALPYFRALVEDEFVQEQLRSAVSGARAAYSRARKQRTQVVEDRGLYRNLRQAATALQKATNALRPPEPEPKHRGRKLVVLALAVGATAFVTARLQKQYSQQRTGGTGVSVPPTDSSAAAAAGQGSTQPQPAGAGAST